MKTSHMIAAGAATVIVAWGIGAVEILGQGENPVGSGDPKKEVSGQHVAQSPERQAEPLFALVIPPWVYALP